MSTLIKLTVGDTGMTISGSITQTQLKAFQQSDLTSVTFSLIGADGARIVNEASATLGTLNTTTGSVPVSYRLQTADVANAIAPSFVRWTLTLADGGKIHAPGDRDSYTFLQIDS